MELHHLRTFVAVARAGHLTRAAERLFISQPAVSAHIKALEEDLGLALFARTPKGMTLTREGRELLPLAESILQKSEELRRSARTLSQEVRGELRIALHTDPQYLRILPLLHLMRDTHPGLELHLHQNMSRAITEDVRAGRLDGGFAYLSAPPEGDLSGLRLTATELYVVAPPGWEARLAPLRWDDLAGEPWIWFTDGCSYSRLHADRLAAFSRSIRKVAVTDYEETLRTLVKSGAGLSLMRQDEALACRDAGEVCVWGGSGLLLEVYFLHRRDRETDPAIRALASALRHTWGLTAGGCA